MLSAETAAGSYPRLAVEAMRRIITEIEKHPPVVAVHAESARSRRSAVSDRGRDRCGHDVRRSEMLARPARRCLHQERLLRAHRRVAPARRADSRRSPTAAHVPAARAGVGRDSRTRAKHCDNYAEMVELGKDVVVARAGARGARRPRGRHRRRSVRRAGHDESAEGRDRVIAALAGA